MDYIYFLANASLTLRVVEYLRSQQNFSVQFNTVIHQIDGWVVKVKMNQPLAPQEDGDFRAYMQELGISYTPEMRLQMAFWSLETGQAPIEVMRRYQIPVVSHGIPDRRDIEAFKEQFTLGLGYCPETLA